MKTEKNIVEKVREFVEEECKKPTSKYGYSPFKEHFAPVVDYSRRLAKKFGADLEIVEIAAWLHDIGSIMVSRENHHITGSEIAERKLRELGYPQDKIEKVKICIYSHRGSQKIGRNILEARILADADAMSCFDDIAGVFMAAFVYENKSRDEARASVRQKMINSYSKLSTNEARLIVKPKYDAAMLLLGDTQT